MRQYKISHIRLLILDKLKLQFLFIAIFILEYKSLFLKEDPLIKTFYTCSYYFSKFFF